MKYKYKNKIKNIEFSPNGYMEWMSMGGDEREAILLTLVSTKKKREKFTDIFNKKYIEDRKNDVGNEGFVVRTSETTTIFFSMLEFHKQYGN